MALHYNI